MTAEPRMEELLASIRKAIHDDIGEVPASMSSRASGTVQRGSMRELHVKVGEELASAASEIQQLREKINRSRTTDALTPQREQPARSASLAAALQAEAPRRSWRELEPQHQPQPRQPQPQPQPRLRSILVDNDAVVAPRAEYTTRPAPEPELPRYAEAHRAWAEEPVALPPPSHEPFRSRADAASILSDDSAQAVQSAFNRLADTVLARATGDKSIEDLTKELLRGMLKQWLDDNLPALVERLVREEIERVARNGR